MAAEPQFSPGLAFYVPKKGFYEQILLNSHQIAHKSRVYSWLVFRAAMFDPLSITASIGFSLAVLSFVSSILPTLIERTSEVAKCRARLKRYFYQLQDHQMGIIKWRYIWYGVHGFPDELYIHCWGHAGYREMHGRLMNIRDLIASLEARLKLCNEHGRHVSLSQFEQQEWNGILENLKINSCGSAARPRFLERIGFALATNAKIQEELESLKTLIEGLGTFSQRLLRDQQEANPETKVTNQELQKLDEAVTLEQGLSSFATDLFTFHSGLKGDHEWDLELRTPDVDGDAALPDIRDTATVNIDFLLQCKCLCKFDMARRFRVEYRTRHHSQVNDLSSLVGESMIDRLRNCSSEPQFHGNLDKQWRILEHPYMQDRPSKELFGEETQSAIVRKALELERLSIALALVNWVILLWNTPWTFAPCNCKIRRVRLQSLQERYVFVSRLDTHCGPACFSEDLSSRKLTLLGIALAELALATSLVVTAGAHDEVVFSMNGRIISRAEFLQNLRRSTRPIGITEAVKYCLNTSDTSENIRAERLQEYAENILEPSVSCPNKFCL